MKMSPPTQLTAQTATDHPLLHLSGFAKMCWPLKNLPIDPEVTFAGKVILVTGANAGLGFEAAVKYAQKACSKLILAVRSAQKGEEAKTTILERSNRAAEKDFITILTVDLADFASVQSFAKELEHETASTGLHIALLNAGLANPGFVQSKYKFEMALQVNVLSTALMAQLILPILQHSAAPGADPPHLTFVNSAGHREVEREWYTGPPSNGSLLAAMNNPDRWDIRKSYCGVKLLGMAVMQHFAQTTSTSTSPSQSQSQSQSQSSVIVNSCCPGLCRTNLGREFGIVQKAILKVVQNFTARSAEQGARTLVSASVLGKESQGGFWHHDVLFPMGEVANDKEDMGKMWEEIRGILKAERVWEG